MSNEEKEILEAYAKWLEAKEVEEASLGLGEFYACAGLFGIYRYLPRVTRNWGEMKVWLEKMIRDGKLYPGSGYRKDGGIDWARLTVRPMVMPVDFEQGSRLTMWKRKEQC